MNVIVKIANESNKSLYENGNREDEKGMEK